MGYRVPLDNLSGTLDSLTTSFDTLDTNAIEWSATTLDSMNQWGALDTWNFGTLDSITSFDVFLGTGSAATSVSVASTLSRILSATANASVAVTVTNTPTVTRLMSASVVGAASVSASAGKARLFSASVNIASTVSSSLTKTIFIDSSVATAVSVSGLATKIRNVSASVNTSVSVSSQIGLIKTVSSSQNIAISVSANQSRVLHFITGLMPESGLTLDNTFSEGTLSGGFVSRSVNTVFSGELTLPSSFTQTVPIFEHGGGGIGAWFGVSKISNVYHLRIRAGEGSTSVNLLSDDTDIAVANVPISDIPEFDGGVHTVTWEFKPSAAGRVRVWIDNNLYIYQETSGSAQLKNGEWAGGNEGGWGVGRSSIAGGTTDSGGTQYQAPPDRTWSGSIKSPLRVYSGELSSFTEDDITNISMSVSATAIVIVQQDILAEASVDISATTSAIYNVVKEVSASESISISESVLSTIIRTMSASVLGATNVEASSKATLAGVTSVDISIETTGAFNITASAVASGSIAIINELVATRVRTASSEEQISVDVSGQQKTVKSVFASANLSVEASSDASSILINSSSVDVSVTENAVATKLRTVTASENLAITESVTATRIRTYSSSADLAITSSSEFIGTFSLVASEEIFLESESNFVGEFVFAVDSVISIDTAMIAKILGEDWIDVDSDNETWSDVAVGSEVWSEVSIGSETWTDIAVGSEIWTQVPTGSEVWLKQ